ncbi:bifunctional FAD-NAD-linked reductase [Babesia duncani]|uniref:Thioredoxin reductase n=1 Tax=Babesia duncani TaxID=323732 RepID=A0AAD9UQ10_9APIC|nr:bifunctional FAD-NAD-linked reductase [Babesia duncani]
MRRRFLAFIATSAPRLICSVSYLLTPNLANSCVGFSIHSETPRHINSFLLSGAFNRGYSTVRNSRMGDYDFDFAVIGGGPGGLAAAKEAAKLGAKTVLFDYVHPSTQGTTWGAGGTCVNVGCIPKKLMHYAALLGKAEHDRQMYGWKGDLHAHDWQQLVNTVQNYVRMLNFSYRSGLLTAGVKYINAHASINGDKLVEYTTKEGTQKISAKYILLAMGERPHIPADVDGALECAITSDDIFKYHRPLGKTLVVGASYVALECAGFLTALGNDTTVAVRSILLRGFDRQCAEKVGELMEAMGTKFIRGVLPTSMYKLDNGKIKVKFADGMENEYDTVLYAVGRSPYKTVSQLTDVGIKFDKSGRIITENDVTSVDGIFAVGDIVSGMPALAPVAVKAGETLARRLFGNDTKLMDYNNIPVCVYTPIEYSSCGLSEERAREIHGDVDVYLSEFTSLELAAAHREKAQHARKDEYDTDMPPSCLTKLVCLKDGTVVGAHFVGPNAGEVMQGIAVAMRLGAKKQDFDNTVGIHPTDAESFVGLTVTKASGQSWIASGGCGGGRCG